MIRTLFLLHPTFRDDRIEPEGQHFYCPHCAMIEGILHYYPKLRDELEIVYVNFPRPRTQIIALVGEDNQGCPNLVVTREAEHKADMRAFSVAGDYYFSNDKYTIANYLAATFDIPRFHP